MIPHQRQTFDSTPLSRLNQVRKESHKDSFVSNSSNQPAHTNKTDGGVELIRPPNWTARKKSLMERFNADQTPNCTANIDYYINELAKEYKASREKQGKRSLLMQKMAENPNNARFLKRKPKDSNL